MIELSIDVLGVAARLRVTVRAENIRLALDLVNARYPAAKAKVVFPIDPESFFTRQRAGAPGMIVSQASEKVAAGSALER